MLRVGELAARAGLTVRTLHHYDSIGLLAPSRSGSGYRLYDSADVARLAQIQALRSLGMALADIGACLDRPEGSQLAIVTRQLAALDVQLAEAARMRDQLLVLQAQLVRGESPALSTWLTTLENMTMYDKYFTKEDLARLPMARDPARAAADWQPLVAQVAASMAAGSAPADPAVRALALRWLELLERDTAGDGNLLMKLDTMHVNEPAVQASSGISPGMRGFMMGAIGELKMAAWARHLTAPELAQMRRHMATRAQEWRPLVAAVQAQMARDPSPHTPAAAALGARWFALFQDMVGSDPATVPRFRHAVASEPLLRQGRAMTDEMVDWLRAARGA